MDFLIVDDSKVMRMLIIRNLRQAGYGDVTFLEAGNGLEAIEIVRKSDPDLIISDWNMPEMNGIELLEKLEELDLDNPLGFVTSECTPEIRNRAFSSGASFFISKPFTPEEFSTEIQAMMF